MKANDAQDYLQIPHEIELPNLAYLKNRMTPKVVNLQPPIKNCYYFLLSTNASLQEKMCAYYNIAFRNWTFIKPNQQHPRIAQTAYMNMLASPCK